MSDQAWVAVIGIVATAAGSGLAAFGAVKIGLVTLTSEMKALREWLKEVAAGERKIDGEFRVELRDHDRRINRIEDRCYESKPPCEEND